MSCHVFEVFHRFRELFSMYINCAVLEEISCVILQLACFLFLNRNVPKHLFSNLQPSTAVEVY